MPDDNKTRSFTRSVLGDTCYSAFGFAIITCVFVVVMILLTHPLLLFIGRSVSDHPELVKSYDVIDGQTVFSDGTKLSGAVEFFALLPLALMAFFIACLVMALTNVGVVWVMKKLGLRPRAIEDMYAIPTTIAVRVILRRLVARRVDKAGPPKPSRRKDRPQ